MASINSAARALSAATGLAAAHVGEVVLDSSSARRMVGDAIEHANGTLFMELHGFKGARPESAFNSFLKGTDGRVGVLAADHVDAANLTSTRGFIPGTTRTSEAAEAGLADGRISLVHYGGDATDEATRPYQHSKLIASTAGGPDGAPTALFNNVKLTDMGSARPDLAATLVGPTARAAIDVVATSLRGSPPLMRQAIDDARSVGLLFNDPIAGRLHLADGMQQLVANARDSIVLVSKGIDDPAFATSLVEAHRRGVRVGVSVRDLARSSAKILHEGGVPVVLHPSRAPASRVNLLMADGETAIASTAYQWDRQLGHAADGRIPRDSGIVLQGTALGQLRYQLAGEPVARAAVQLLDSPETATVARSTYGWGSQNPWSFPSLADVMVSGGQRLVDKLD